MRPAAGARRKPTRSSPATADPGGRRSLSDAVAGRRVGKGRGAPPATRWPTPTRFLHRGLVGRPRRPQPLPAPDVPQPRAATTAPPLLCRRRRRCGLLYGLLLGAAGRQLDGRVPTAVDQMHLERASGLLVDLRDAV